MMSRDEALLVFARHPERGKVKTRLAREIGEEAALGAYTRMLRGTLDLARDQAIRGRRVSVGVSPAERRAAFQRDWAAPLSCFTQSEGDLGTRLASAFEAAWSEGASRVVAIGSDCPALTSAHLDQAFWALSRTPAVLGPAVDGGYYLIGLSKPVHRIFEGIPWSTPQVLARTLERLEGAGIRPELLETLSDIDQAEDLLKETRA